VQDVFPSCRKLVFVQCLSTWVGWRRTIRLYMCLWLQQKGVTPTHSKRITGMRHLSASKSKDRNFLPFT
jgi:hypothetical protein